MVLGSAIGDREVAAKLIALDDPKLFTGEVYRGIFSRLQASYRASGECDAGALIAHGADPAEIQALLGRASNRASAISGSLDLHRLSRLRLLEGSCRTVFGKCASDKADPDDLLSEVLTQNVASGSHSESAGAIAKRLRKEGVPPILPTPWPSFNDAIKGVRLPSMVVLAAETSVGKTVTACQWAGSLCKQGYECLFFSLEQHPSLITEILIKQNGWDSLPENFYISGNARSLSQIATHTKMFCRTRRHKVIVVDYVQLMSAGQPGDGNRANELESISNALLQLASSNECLLIATSQFIKNKTGSRPVMSDLKGSSALSQAPDTVIMLYRAEEGSEVIYFDCQKNRTVGKVGRASLRFDSDRLLMVDPQGEVRQEEVSDLELDAEALFG